MHSIGSVIFSVLIIVEACTLEASVIAGKKEMEFFRLDESGVFHRYGTESGNMSITTPTRTYSVLESGVLTPASGPYAIKYRVNAYGNLIPTLSNKCIYKSDNAAFYFMDNTNRLIPVKSPIAGLQLNDTCTRKFCSKLQPTTAAVVTPAIRSSDACCSKLQPKTAALATPDIKSFCYITPDTSCNGQVTLFSLSSDGLFHRNPPDDYLPNGLAVTYQLSDDGSLLPKRPTALNSQLLQLTYLTGARGSLVPCVSNTHTLTTINETRKSYMLAEGGILAPVSETFTSNDTETVDYYFDGSLIHRSRQFRRTYSNASMVKLTQKQRDERHTNLPVDFKSLGPRFECGLKKIMKRDTKSAFVSKECSVESHNFNPYRQSTFVFDDRGKRIPLDPYVNEKGRVAIYKLTCKGHLKRIEPYKEPEYGFQVMFRLIDSYILVPTGKNNGRIHLRYTLQENGSLAPVKNQRFTFKKAPASMLYFILARTKELVPVRLKIVKNQQIEVYYQESLVFKMPGKDLSVLTTQYAPLYAYLNNRLTIIYHDPLPKPESANTWTNTDKSPNYPSKNLYLVGPDKIRIKIEIDLNKNNVPVIFEMDWNGVWHKSPKDNNKNLMLKGYKLLPEGILVASNESNDYIYLVDKQGNMLPYCYPDSKLRAPHGLTVKYVKCKSSILLPILVEATDHHVRFSFHSNIIYYKKAYTIDDIIERTLDEQSPTTIYQQDNGQFVYFQRLRKTFYRHPKKKIANHLLDQTGYLNVLPGGILEPSNYPYPAGVIAEALKIQVDQQGNILILKINKKVTIGEHYMLAKNASLIPVEVERGGSYLKVLRNGLIITSIPYTDGQQFCTNMTNIPLTTTHTDDSDSGSDSDADPHHITIPINESMPKNEHILTIDSAKCQQIRNTIRELVDHDPSMVGTELEMSDSMMEQIYRLVCNCSNTKCPQIH